MVAAKTTLVICLKSKCCDMFLPFPPSSLEPQSDLLHSSIYRAAGSDVTRRPLPSPQTHLLGNPSRSTGTEGGEAHPICNKFHRAVPQLPKIWAFRNCLPFFYWVRCAKNKHVPKMISDVPCIQLCVSSGGSLARSLREMVYCIFFRATEQFPLGYKRFCSWYLPVKEQVFTPQSLPWY